MSGRSTGGLAEPDLRRRYLRAVATRAGRKVNGAHIYLASILQAQDHWDYAPFCRTIFTTNFDPLLQHSLQLVNKLYYMTDRPDVLEAPHDDETDAIHLIYTHGSIHRYLLLNTQGEIEGHARLNAPSLTSYFQRHGVIVIGYSGWSDTTMQALESCASFNGNLYWCDVHDEATAGLRLRPQVIAFLQKRRGNAFYVECRDANTAMAQLHHHLKLGDAPQFILAPIKQGLHQLRNIDVSTIGGGRRERPGSDRLTLVLERTLSRMKMAQQAFDNPKALGGGRRDREGNTLQIGVAAQRMNDAKDYYDRGRTKQAISLWTQAIEDPRTPVDEAALALINRALAYSDRQDTDRAYADYTAVIAKHPLNPDLRAWALVNRGIIQADRGARSRELADYSRALSMRGAASDTRSLALLNRGLTYSDGGAWRKAIADFSAIISMNDAPADLKVQALVDRGRARGELSNTAGELEDYTAAANDRDAPVEERTRALLNRALTFGRQKKPKLERIDYTTVIELKGAPVADRAQAFLGRGYVSEKHQDLDAAISDYSAAIRLRNAPVEFRSQALLNRGIAMGLKGHGRRELADYSRILTLRGAPADHKAQALVNRGVGLAEAGRTKQAISDYTAVIAMNDVAIEHKAEALSRRAEARLEAGLHKLAAGDWRTLRDMKAAPRPWREKARLAVARLVRVSAGARPS